MAKKKPKPTAANDLNDYIRYELAQPFMAKTLTAFDKDFHPHPHDRKFWTAVCSPELELSFVVHVAVAGRMRELVGYLITEYTGKSFIEIHRLLVAPHRRRIKVATRLLLTAIAEKPYSANKLIYTVPENDLDTQVFLRASGFKAKAPLVKDAFPGYNHPDGIKFIWREHIDGMA